MTSFLLAGLCLAASAVLVRLLDRWCRPAKFHDLTRGPQFLHQVERQHNNDLSIAAYEARCEALNVPRIRPLPTNEGN